MKINGNHGLNHNFKLNKKQSKSETIKEEVILGQQIEDPGIMERPLQSVKSGAGSIVAEALDKAFAGTMLGGVGALSSGFGGVVGGAAATTLATLVGFRVGGFPAALAFGGGVGTGAAVGGVMGAVAGGAVVVGSAALTGNMGPNYV